MILHQDWIVKKGLRGVVAAWRGQRTARCCRNRPSSTWMTLNTSLMAEYLRRHKALTLIAVLQTEAW